MWEVGLPPSPVEFSSHCRFYKLSRSWLLITGWCCCSCQLPCLFTVHVGSGSSLLPCGVFLPPPLSQAFPLLVAGGTPGSRQRLSSQARLVYLQFWEGFPSPSLRCLVCPTLFSMCLFCSYCLLLSFSFFPRWGSVCPGGYADLAQACLWEYCSTAKLTLSASSQAICVWAIQHYALKKKLSFLHLYAFASLSKTN
jgi:hypothetical protein